MLLDTHIFLWWLFDDARLPVNIREYIHDIDNTEVTIKLKNKDYIIEYTMAGLRHLAKKYGSVNAALERTKSLGTNFTEEDIEEHLNFLELSGITKKHKKEVRRTLKNYGKYILFRVDKKTSLDYLNIFKVSILMLII